ncbi:MAG: MFS transporter [Deltaproteobacteria bacterium]|nr:MFS transporter [Deltaproteobacteria bacterium]MBW2137419.1 MFS transporter [Deltaproteobacteria bacterium]
MEIKQEGIGSVPLYRDRNLQIVFGITLMAVMGVASISPAFPAIIAEFRLSPRDIGWLISVFTLPGVVLAPLLGVLADRWGRKRILVPSLFIFSMAGVGCVFAGTYTQLLVLRFFQGVGAAAIGSLNVTLIGDLFSGKQRGAAMGYNASVLSIGTACYPLIGGLLAVVGWNFPFLLPLLAVPVALLVLFVLKNPEPQKQQSLSAYFRRILSALNLEVFGLYLASCVTFIILYGSYLTYYPILIERRFSGGPVEIGVVMSLMSFSTAFSSAQLGRLVQRFSESSLIRASYLLYAAALVLMLWLPNMSLQVLPALLYGVAHGINFPSIQTILAGIAPLEQRAAFMSLNGMVLRLGQTLGPLLMGFVYNFGGIGASFYAGAILGLGMAGLAIWLIPKAQG